MGIVGLAIGFAALIVGVASLLLTRKQVQKKELAYDVIVDTKLLETSALLEDRVQILFDRSPVRDVSIILIRIWNSGNQTILRDDFEAPILFSFGNARLLSAEVIAKVPSGLSPVLKRRDSLALEPLLLNRGDAFIVKVLLTDHRDKIDVEARVAGVKGVCKRPYDMRLVWRNRVYWFFFPLCLLTVAIDYWPGVLGTKHVSGHLTFLDVLFLCLVIVSGVGAILLLFWNRLWIRFSNTSERLPF